MSYHPYNNYNLSAQPNSSSSTRSPHSQYRDSPPASGNPPFPAQGGASRLPFPTHHGPSQNGPPLPPIMAQYPQAQDNPPHPAGAMAQLGRSPHMSDVNWAAMPPPNGPQHPQGPGLTGSAHPTPSPPWYLPSSAHGTSQYLPDGRNPDPSRSRHPPYNDFQDTRRQPEGPPPPVSHRPPASDPGSSQGPPPPPEDGNGRQSGWLSSRRFSGWLSSTSSVIQYVNEFFL
jgi:hypothetical protein